MTSYLYPGSIEEALGCLERYEGTAQVIAGGTDLMPDLRLHKRSPVCLVDITRIPGLDQITRMEDGVQVGAAVTFAALRDSPLIRQRVPALAEAARSVGAAPIQAVATWAGNIVQAMPAADGAIVALALEAEARLADSLGAGWQPVESLFVGPGRSAVDPTRQLITHLRFRLPPGTWGTAWNRVGRRESLVLPILNCAARLCLHPDGAHISQANLALGPVAPCPYRARRAESFLVGQPAEAEVFRQAARIVQQESDPRNSPVRASRDYRLSIIPPLIVATLTDAARRARELSW
jgi:carbon-monoxide dehydrogenase medium subunit